MKILNTFLLILVICFADQAYSCTTAIINGKSSMNGRPLLYKHRDTGFEENKLAYFDDGIYSYIGLLNAEDSLGSEVWAGCNSAGFAIMNSESYNLNIGDSTTLKDRDGFIMKRALQICSSVDDFATLLDTMAKPLGVRANFGVIDAGGGAAYFETGQVSYNRYDAIDPQIAPDGYLIRTNFSESGKEDAGYGYIRYATASGLFEKAFKENLLSPQFLITQVSRSLYHSLLKHDISLTLPVDDSLPVYKFFEDYIPRYSSASVMVVEGVQPGEDPAFSTIWTVLGPPLCTPAVPCWVSGADLLPGFLKCTGSGEAEICSYGLQNKKRLFPIERGSGKRYLNLSALSNQKNSGILQQILPVEEAIFAKTDRFMDTHKTKFPDQRTLAEFYAWLEAKIKRLIHPD